jgi:hypothetical protein
MPRRTPVSVPSTLRLADLHSLSTPYKLVNVRVPEDVFTAIYAIAAGLRCSKGKVVIALLNEGLDAFEERRGEFVRRSAACFAVSIDGRRRAALHTSRS